MTEDEMTGWHHRHNGDEFEKDREAWHAAAEQLSPWASTTAPALESPGKATAEARGTQLLRLTRPRARAPQRERPPQREA